LANTQALRRRIRSVRSTQQITKAMKMVAAARLRRAQSRIVEARPYAEALSAVLASVAGRVTTARHPLLEQRQETRVTLLVISGDKGLCGAFNSNVLREAAALLAARRWPQTELMVVGRKGIDYFRFKGVVPVFSDAELMSRVTPEAAFALGRRLAERFASRDTDAIYLLSNRFRSVIQQRVTLERLLPLSRSEIQEGDGRQGYIFGALLNQLLPRYVEFSVLRALLSSQAAEHAARMTAMDAASKNAAEMIDKLTLTYNRVRQASITKELIEIVSGAQALGER